MTARDISAPKVGHYKMRIGGTAEVPSTIFIPCPADPEFHPMERRTWRPLGWIYGIGIVDPDRVWLSRHEEITSAEFDLLVSQRDWDARYAPESAGANPREKRSIGDLPVVEF